MADQTPESPRSLPRLVLTGASGFVGRHLLDGIKEDYEIYALARRSQVRCGAPFHDNIHWHQVDIGDQDTLARIFRQIQNAGPVEAVIHLAAHFDFDGEDEAEYYRTNVDGLRNVLDNCRGLRPRRFVFSSSLAACEFPEAGKVLNEYTPPDGTHIYARTKAIGERMLLEYEDAFPSVIVRFAAMFSDWCEYPPLYMFLRTWFSKAWNARLLGGRGSSAIPYLHIRDAESFLRKLLLNHEKLMPGEVLIASLDGSVSHRKLYDASVNYHFDKPRPPLFVPKFMVRPGIKMRMLFCRLVHEEPFERPWMADFVDKQLTVDASRTRRRLGWAPRPRLEVIHRLPFLLENLVSDPVEWTRRNRDAMKTKSVTERPNLKIQSLLTKNTEEIGRLYTERISQNIPHYKQFAAREHDWNYRMVLRQLRTAIRTRVRIDFLSYCHDLMQKRMDEGFSGRDLVLALETLDEVCMETLHGDPEAEDVLQYLYQHITMTIRFGIDQVMETCEELQERYPERYPQGCE